MIFVFTKENNMWMYILETILNLGLGFLVFYAYKEEPALGIGVLTVIILQELTRYNKHKD